MALAHNPTSILEYVVAFFLPPVRFRVTRNTVVAKGRSTQADCQTIPDRCIHEEGNQLAVFHQCGADNLCLGSWHPARLVAHQVGSSSFAGRVKVDLGAVLLTCTFPLEQQEPQGGYRLRPRASLLKCFTRLGSTTKACSKTDGGRKSWWSTWNSWAAMTRVPRA